MIRSYLSRTYLGSFQPICKPATTRFRPVGSFLDRSPNVPVRRVSLDLEDVVTYRMTGWYDSNELTRITLRTPCLIEHSA